MTGYKVFHLEKILQLENYIITSMKSGPLIWRNFQILKRQTTEDIDKL